MFITTQPRDRWCRLFWRLKPGSRDVHQLEQIAPLFATLKQIPGVDVRQIEPLEGFIDAHESVWALEPLVRAYAMAGKEFPTPEHQKNRHWPPTPYRLFDHQREAWARLVANRGGILADDMGLGKTRSAACAAAALVQHDQPRLILGPLFVRNTWRQELEAAGLLEGPEDFAHLSGLEGNSLEFTRARWWFCHYDIIAAWQSRLNFNKRGRAGVVILDEAHHIRNGRNKRTKGAGLAAGTIPQRILLTGTPLVNRPTDLWSLLNILDGHKAWGAPSLFRERYSGAIRTDFGWQDGPPTNESELRARLDGRYTRRTKGEVLHDLPKLTRTTITTSMRDTDREAHAAMLGGRYSPVMLVDALMQGRVGEEVLRVLGALRQTTSTAKLVTTADYVASALEQGASVVVFAHERAMAEKLGKRVDAALGDDEELYTIHGGYPIESRDEIVKRFQRPEPGARAIFATYGALREGVTLTHASIVVLHDLSWLPSEILQAEARVHRIGSASAVQSIWSVAEDSIDTIFARVLLEKARTQSDVLGMPEAQRAFDEVSLRQAVGIRSFDEEVEHLFRSWR